jgi:hypothetical protein
MRPLAKLSGRDRSGEGLFKELAALDSIPLLCKPLGGLPFGLKRPLFSCSCPGIPRKETNISLSISKNFKGI